MNAEQFTYWLQGFLEISNVTQLDENQVGIIRDHLDLVFNKVTPNRKPVEIPTYPEDRIGVGYWPQSNDDKLIC